jgi:hypothetical protein
MFVFNELMMMMLKMMMTAMMTTMITALCYANTLIGTVLLHFPAMKHTITHILEFAPELSVEHVIFYLIYYSARRKLFWT